MRQYERAGMHEYKQEHAEIIAESWEIADRPEGMSIVSNGPLKGTKLHELVQAYGSKLLGYNYKHNTFPLLIKIIDAKQRLSVQVHPDEATARNLGGEPKTEMWYVLDADPDALVYAGFKKGVTKKKFQEALTTDHIEELLQKISVAHGDIIYIPGGRLHCIGEGCLLLEIQQNSNTTYRVHDWGRIGSDGKPRELHIKEALKAIHWNDTSSAKASKPGSQSIARNRHAPTVAQKQISTQKRNEMFELIRSPYFRIEQIRLRSTLSFPMNGKTFHILFLEDGQLEISAKDFSTEIKPGTTVLIPASMNSYHLASIKSASLLRITLP